MPDRESKLQAVTSADGTTSSVEIVGTGKEQLFNLALLTRDVANTLGMPPVVLASILPGMIHEYERTGMASVVKVDLGTIRKGGVAP